MPRRSTSYRSAVLPPVPRRFAGTAIGGVLPMDALITSLRGVSALLSRALVRPYPRDQRPVVGLLVAAIVVSLLATGCSGSTNSPDGGAAAMPEEVEVIDETAPVTVEVSPREPFKVTLPDGTRVSGPKGAVSRAGPVTLTPATKQVPPDSPLYGSQLAGFDLTHPGKLRRPLTVSFPAPESPAGKSGRQALPAAVHVGGDGEAAYQSVTRKGDRFTLTTDDFSFWAPGWLNPGQWVKDLFGSVGRSLGGTQKAPDCTDAQMSWATLVNGSAMIHTCLKDNRNDQGISRAELFAKSNRNYWMKVPVPAGADYEWREGADTLLGQGVPWFTGDRDEQLLAPGEQMSAGYLRPNLDQTLQLTPYSDLETLALSTTLGLASQAGADGRAGFAMLWAVKSCADKVPSGTPTAGDVAKVVVCVFADALPQLADDKKAVAAAYSMLELSPRTYAPEGVKALTDTAKTLQLLGKAVKAVALLQIIQGLVVQIVDGVDEASSGRKSASLELRAGVVPESALMNTTIPPTACSAPGYGGWKGTRGIKLVDGSGDQRQDGDSYLSILSTQVLGWTQLTGDDDPEVVLGLRCSGTKIEYCCAGQSSTLKMIVAFEVEQAGAKLTQFSDPFAGTLIYPGGKYGPASGFITEASLSGSTVTVQQGVLYNHTYKQKDMSGWPLYEPQTTTHALDAQGHWSGTTYGR